MASSVTVRLFSVSSSYVARFVLVVAGVMALALHIRSVHASPTPLVRDFYGEADEDVTAVLPVPDGMVCGPLTVGSGLSVETSEPPEGFTGACLMNRPYGARTPVVCYSPTGATYGDSASVQCSAPAANVLQPSWYINADQARRTVTRQYTTTYRVLETCTPHVASQNSACGSCPCNTQLVSHSCCTQFGISMTSGDGGKTATGTAYFKTQ